MSEDWQRANQQLAQAGAPNEIGTLVAQRPFHAPTLIAAATMCCSMGLFDLAIPLCVRACASYTFYRRDAVVADCEATKSFFDAVFLLARLAAKRGAKRTAANLFRACFKLNPDHDPCLVSLRLASDLYIINEYKAIAQLSEEEFGQFIPDTRLCQALYLYNTQKDQAIEYLSQTLAAFPQLLSCLLDACEIRADNINSRFREILWRDHFRKNTWLTHQASAYALTSLPRALDVACLRQHAIWRHPDHIEFLRLAAENTQIDLPLLQQVNSFWTQSPLALKAKELDVFAQFSDDFPRLDPAVIEDFDTSLLEPHAAQRMVGTLPTTTRVMRPHQQQITLPQLMAHLPPDLQQQFQFQLDSGVPAEEIQATLLQLVI